MPSSPWHRSDAQHRSRDSRSPGSVAPVAVNIDHSTDVLSSTFDVFYSLGDNPEHHQWRCQSGHSLTQGDGIGLHSRHTRASPGGDVQHHLNRNRPRRNRAALRFTCTPASQKAPRPEHLAYRLARAKADGLGPNRTEVLRLTRRQRSWALRVGSSLGVSGDWGTNFINAVDLQRGWLRDSARNGSTQSRYPG